MTMKKLDFRTLVMLLCVASMTVFASCDNKGNEPDDPQGGSTENNGGEETPTPESPVTFTLTLLSSNEAMGTVTEGGTYEKDAEVIIEATAKKEACVFVKWSDGNTENPRTLTMTENITLTAEFDYAYVDLGLSVKWAKCNVGADSVHHSGGYYAWGEVEEKDDYAWSTYFDTTDGGSTFLKYNNESGKTTLDKEDDAAAVNMGEFWRMPTIEEQKELIDECTWTWTTLNGVNGYNVEGSNGNSIFLPAAGYCNDSGLSNVGSHGYCWSSSLYTSSSKYADNLYFGSDDVDWSGYYRYCGQPVRGVCE